MRKIISGAYSLLLNNIEIVFLYVFIAFSVKYLFYGFIRSNSYLILFSIFINLFFFCLISIYLYLDLPDKKKYFKVIAYKSLIKSYIPGFMLVLLYILSRISFSAVKNTFSAFILSFVLLSLTSVVLPGMIAGINDCGLQEIFDFYKDSVQRPQNFVLIFVFLVIAILTSKMALFYLWTSAFSAASYFIRLFYLFTAELVNSFLYVYIMATCVCFIKNSRLSIKSLNNG